MSVLRAGEPFRVFIGWDSREVDAFRVAAHSVARHASVPLSISPIKLADLRAAGWYRRSEDVLASTEFTYSRFLTPALAAFTGHALFFDCDFLWTGDIADLLTGIDPEKAVSCVKHDHRPMEQSKMDGARQTQYPRKNWSSLMVFNCEHLATRRLTVETVNAASPAYLHRMQWAEDPSIGEISETWNWLEGWSARSATGAPKAIHFTRGGPWFEAWRNVAYADLWLRELELARAAGA